MTADETPTRKRPNEGATARQRRAEEERRLAAALRANLARRKLQARTRAAGDDPAD